MRGAELTLDVNVGRMCPLPLPPSPLSPTDMWWIMGGIDQHSGVKLNGYIISIRNLQGFTDFIFLYLGIYIYSKNITLTKVSWSTKALKDLCINFILLRFYYKDRSHIGCTDKYKC